MGSWRSWGSPSQIAPFESGMRPPREVPGGDGFVLHLLSDGTNGKSDFILNDLSLLAA